MHLHFSSIVSLPHFFRFLCLLKYYLLVYVHKLSAAQKQWIQLIIENWERRTIRSELAFPPVLSVPELKKGRMQTSDGSVALAPLSFSWCLFHPCRIADAVQQQLWFGRAKKHEETKGRWCSAYASLISHQARSQGVLQMMCAQREKGDLSDFIRAVRVLFVADVEHQRNARWHAACGCGSECNL